MKPFLQKYYIWLLALGGAACVWGLSLAPVHSSKLMTAVALVSLLLAALAVWVQRSASARARLSAGLDGIVARPGLFRLLVGINALVFAAGWVWLFLPESRVAGFFSRGGSETYPYYALTQPLVAWLTACAAQTGLALCLWRGLRWPPSNDWKGIFKTGGMILGILLLLWGLIAVTRLGLEPVGVFWYAPGTPLLLTQALLAWALGILFLFVETRWNGRSPKSAPRLDVLVAVLLWALACLLWIATPVTRPTIFQPAPAAPNYAPYPFSDAANYDVNAQGLLVGQGFSLDPSLKPIYSLFLAFLHMLAGQDYTRIVNLQIIFLALIPVLLYLLGRLFSNRPAGLIAAVLFILREKNSLELSNIIQVSHVKLLLSDLPATGLMIALVILLAGWLLKPESRRLWPLAAGGVLGMALVLRAQVIAVIPFILLGAALALYRNRRALLRQGALLLLLGALASALPWLGYGYFANSRLQSPDYVHLLALQFRDVPVADLRQLPGETAQQFDARVQNQMVAYVRQNPALVAQSIAAYFVHNAVQSVSFLPLSPQFETDAVAYTRNLPLWDNWTGDLPVEARLMLALNLALLALGLGALWTRFRHAGLLLLLVFAGYVTSLALPMLSGWRFLLPVDWIVYFYIAIGLMELTLLVRSLLRTQPDPSPAPVTPTMLPPASLPPLSWSRLGILTLCFALINLSLPITQSLIPVRYPPLTKQQLLAAYPQNSKLPTAAEMGTFLEQKNAVVFYGRALYPRFFAAGTGLHSTGWASFIARDYSRLGFYVVGPFPGDVVLPLAQSPAIFPHAADVRVFGCLRDADANNRRFVQAWVVIVHAEKDSFLRASGPAPDCASGQ